MVLHPTTALVRFEHIYINICLNNRFVLALNLTALCLFCDHFIKEY